MKSTALLLFLLLFSPALSAQYVFRCDSGTVRFHSDAPLELIEASSKNLKGIIRPSTREFAFSVSIRSFDGFNAALQRDHFNENYLESARFHTAHFTGKIIEDVNLDEPGLYQVRAKGILNIHGVPQERIIKASLRIREKTITVDSAFPVRLADHAIRVPRVVHEKISSEVRVSLHAELVQQAAKK